MNKDSRIYVVGHTGLVGSALMRRLQKGGYTNVRTATLDLRDTQMVRQTFEQMRPEYVFMAAGRVGGILANIDRPAEFISDNLRMSVNVIDACHVYGVKKLLYLGSSCCYPRDTPQPMREEQLWTGPLEPTNQPYAVAKLAAIEMCRAYRQQYGLNAIVALPANLYGPLTDRDVRQVHVVEAIMRKCIEAKDKGSGSVGLIGTGMARRELMHVDDCAGALVFLMERYDGDMPVNVGVGNDIRIEFLVDLVKAAVGYKGYTGWEMGDQDGMPQKLLDVGRLRWLGWSHKISLAEGLRGVYEAYRTARS